MKNRAAAVQLLGESAAVRHFAHNNFDLSGLTGNTKRTHEK
jgi:hypothetical protein